MLASATDAVEAGAHTVDVDGEGGRGFEATARVSVDKESTLNLTLLVGRVTATSLPPERITLRKVLEVEAKTVLVDCKVISGLSDYHQGKATYRKTCLDYPRIAQTWDDWLELASSQRCWGHGQRHCFHFDSTTRC